jgi:hypothetical protein
MTNIVLIDKTGTVKQLNAKSACREHLYKKCGFKKSDGFERRTTWKIGDEFIELWAKKEGKANSENKYDMPPPVDTALYFGTCCLIKTNSAGETIEDLTTAEWSKMYETLFGGFEDIDVEEEPSEDELDEIPDECKTSSGYLKDGFVVEDDVKSDESGSDYGSELEEEEYEY